MNKFESKYFNTAKKIDAAFLSLLNKKDFEFITVKEICEQAKVNRSTFYLHYSNLDDLLKECNDYLINKFLNSINITSLTQKDISNLPIEELNFVTPKYLLPWLEFIKGNKVLFSTYVNKFSTFMQNNNNELLFKNIVDPVFNKLNIKNESKQYVLQFHIAGIMAIVNCWVKNGCKEDVDTMCDIVIGCINY